MTATDQATMLAYVLEQFGDLPRLTRVPRPEVGDNEVLVKTHSSSVNPADWMTGAGGFKGIYEYRLPATIGRDVAGTVEAVGERVTRFAPGDAVFGFVKREYIGDGTFAEYVAVPEDRYIVHQPSGVEPIEAGAAPLASVTAFQCLQALGLDPGGSVFVNGATGGVGSFALQLAAAERLDVIATARPGAETEHVRALGAAEVVDWSCGDLLAAVRAVRPDGVNGVVDLISRDSGSFTALAEGLLQEGGTATSTLSAAPAELVSEGRAINIHSDPDPALLERIARLLAAGRLRVPIAATFDFERIEDAFAVLSAGVVGKVALTFR